MCVWVTNCAIIITYHVHIIFNWLTFLRTNSPIIFHKRCVTWMVTQRASNCCVCTGVITNICGFTTRSLAFTRFRTERTLCRSRWNRVQVGHCSKDYLSESNGRRMYCPNCKAYLPQSSYYCHQRQFCDQIKNGVWHRKWPKTTWITPWQCYNYANKESFENITLSGDEL